MNESVWIERAQSAEARLETLKQTSGPALERVKEFKTNFGVKERQNGEIIIDFETFAKNLGIENAFALRAVIDETYNISGEPGKKPHLKLVND